jgi:aldehyde:ferredoxin oxidoreductase
MDPKVKKVLIVNLENKTSEVKSFIDLNIYIGGVGLGLKLAEMYKDHNPVIFSIGPLNGFFPFASKTALILNDKGAFEDLYIGGNLSLRIR